MNAATTIAFLALTIWGFIVLRHRHLHRIGIISFCLVSFGAVMALWLGIPTIARAIALQGDGGVIARFSQFISTANHLIAPCLVILSISIAFLGLIGLRALSSRSARGA